MPAQLQQIITAARALSTREKLELLEVLAQDLQQTSTFDDATAHFWAPRSLDTLAAEQTAAVVTDVHALAADFWPADESADAINAYITAQRHADRLRNA